MTDDGWHQAFSLAVHELVGRGELTSRLKAALTEVVAQSAFADDPPFEGDLASTWGPIRDVLRPEGGKKCDEKIDDMTDDEREDLARLIFGMHERLCLLGSEEV